MATELYQRVVIVDELPPVQLDGVQIGLTDVDDPANVGGTSIRLIAQDADTYTLEFNGFDIEEDSENVVVNDISYSPAWATILSMGLLTPYIVAETETTITLSVEDAT